MKIKVQTGQTLFDVALEYYGNIEGVALIFNDNPNISFDSVSEGDELNIRDDEPLDKPVVDYYKKRNYMPVTN